MKNKTIILIALHYLLVGCSINEWENIRSSNELICEPNQFTNQFQVKKNNKFRPSRTFEEIAIGMDCNKKAIRYLIHKHNIDKNLNTKEKVVIEFRINPNGYVSDAKIRRSDLKNELFHNDLLDTINKIKFEEREVEEMIVTYPIDI